MLAVCAIQPTVRRRPPSDAVQALTFDTPSVWKTERPLWSQVNLDHSVHSVHYRLPVVVCCTSAHAIFYPLHSGS